MINIRVRITRDDILAGAAEDCVLCPAAIAINRALAERFGARLYLARVFRFRVEIWDAITQKCIESISSPDRLFRFVAAFDGFSPSRAKPISFILTLPSHIFPEKTPCAS